MLVSISRVTRGQAQCRNLCTWLVWHICVIPAIKFPTGPCHFCLNINQAFVFHATESCHRTQACVNTLRHSETKANHYSSCSLQHRLIYPPFLDGWRSRALWPMETSWRSSVGSQEEAVCMITFTLFNINYFTGALPIHWCIMGAISAEPSMHYATFRRSLLMGCYEWVN